MYEVHLKENKDFAEKLHYCYVYGGERNLNFHAWLSNMTIKRLKSEGCIIKIQDYKYQL